MTLCLVPVAGRLDRLRFYRFPQKVYRDYPQYRAPDEAITRWLVDQRSVFCRHAQILPFFIKQGRRVVGRFALIHDRRLKDFVQVAFFQALPDLPGVASTIIDQARSLFPQCPKIVVGLSGHLNYACGFLASNYELPPLFGLPYSPAYYLDYFADLQRIDMVSYRFGNQGFYDLRNAVQPNLDLGGVTIRFMDKRRFAREMEIYTYLNNACFQQHPYWADRTAEEDHELFYGLRHFLKEENFIFAEQEGRPVGFLLWYPDYNELLGAGQELGLRSFARYHLRNTIKTVRLTQIAVHPEFRSKKVVAGMKMKMIERVESGGYSFTEGGYIFEQNDRSMGATLAYLSRAMGRPLEPHRRYCVFEAAL